MNFALNEVQDMLRSSARELLAKECPLRLVRDAEATPDGISRALWQTLSAQGWPGLALPKEHGGAAADFLDLVVLLEELGYALAPVPYLETVVAAGLTLAAAGNKGQQAKLLPGIVRGETLMALALTETDGDFDPAAVSMTAVKTGHGYRLNGTKLFVAGAAVADYFLVAARTAGTSGDKTGLSLFIVAAGTPGVTVTALDTIAGDRQCEIVFGGVTVREEDVIGQVDAAYPVILAAVERGAVAECARMTGMAAHMLEMTVSFTNERIVYGKQLGVFQVIQHRACDMLVDVEASRFTTYEAAWRIGQGLEAWREVAIAKAWTSDACQRVCADASHIHGAIGFTDEHDAPLFLRRAKAAELAFGDSAFHTALVGAGLTGS